MNNLLIPAIAGSAIIACAPAAVSAPAGSTFTYQGNLTQGGTPFSGSANLQFRLFPAEVGGVQIGLTQSINTTVTDGVFTVDLDFGDVFDTELLWLGITVNGTTLNPRQPVRPAPVAMYALNSDSPWTISGNVAYNTDKSFGIGTNNPTELLDVNGDVRVRDKILVDMDDEPMLTAGQNNTIARRMWLSHSLSFPDWGIQYRDFSEGNGYPGDSIEFTATDGEHPRAGIDLFQGQIFTYNGVDSNWGTMLDTDTSVGGTLTLRRPDGSTTMTLTGDAAGTRAGQLQIFSDDNRTIDLFAHDSFASCFEMYNNDGNQTVLFYGSAGTTDTGSRLFMQDGDSVTQITLNGSTGLITADSLNLTGGADLSESFDVGGDESIRKPGMVMCIDPANPGSLIPSTRAYDRTVAGVISGANGVNPGMIMGQDDSIADGDYPVALTGRVWVYCDASTGAITPGDLLTTAAMPGHAMKVSEHARATGATIGKAMTSLESGQGLVLVLISLH